MNVQLRECILPDGCELVLFEKKVKGQKAEFHIELVDGGNYVQVSCLSEKHANRIYDSFLDRKS